MTVSFSPISNGWTSFWSYEPEWMAGLNSSFYTWKDGNLYVHDSNEERNAFYYDFNEDAYFLYDSTITSVLNTDPNTIKVFKTVSLDSDQHWTCEMNTDISSGQIQGSYFVDKEGQWYAHIRNLSGTIDTKSLSIQGVGILDSLSPSNTLNFAFDISNTPSIGDLVHAIDLSNVMHHIGTVLSYTNDSIVMTSMTAYTPTSGEMIVYTRNSEAESYGLRGYYMDVKFTNSSTKDVEFFAYSSEVFKSYP
jgi:hypothetical protein